MMKKIFAVLLVCAMFLPILASCGSMQAGELDVTAYDAEGNYVQNVSFDSSKVTGYTGRTEMDMTGGEYDPTTNPDGTYDTYTSRRSWATVLADWFGTYDTTTFEIATDLGKVATSEYYPQYEGKLVYEIDTAEEFASFLRMLNYAVSLGESALDPALVAAGFVKKEGDNKGVEQKPAFDFSNRVIVLTRDFDVSGVDHIQPAGNGSNFFNGILDGQGHVVKGRKQTFTSHNGSLLGPLVNATVKNIAFVDYSADAFLDSDGQNKVWGGLSVWSAGDVVIENVYFQGTSVGGSSNIGALIGEVKTGSVTIKNSKVDFVFGGEGETLISGSQVGGMIGIAQKVNVSISNCEVVCEMDVAHTIGVKTSSPLDANDDSATDLDESGNAMHTISAYAYDDDAGYGAIIGKYNCGTSGKRFVIENCRTSGSITAGGYNVGGLVGHAYTSSTTVFEITNVENNVDLTVGNISFAGAPEGIAYYTKSGDNYVAFDPQTAIDAQTVNRATKWGGIVGNKDSSGECVLQNCTNNGNVSAGAMAAGLVGAKGNTSKDRCFQIINCVNNGDITTVGNHVAGFVAYMTQGPLTVTGGSNNGAISGASNVGGGFATMGGAAGNAIVIDGFVNNGKVSGGTKVGGIMASRGNHSKDFANLCQLTIKDCVNNGAVSATNATSYVAGILACVGGGNNADNANKLTITGCVNNGAISGHKYVAGVLAVVTRLAYESNSTKTYYRPASEIEVSDCVNNGEINGEAFMAGIGASLSDDATNTFPVVITSCVNNGTVLTVGSDGRAAGIVGHYAGVSIAINSCTNNGDILAPGSATDTQGRWCGGIFGYLLGTKTNVVESVTINNCKSYGDIVANRSSGGLGGYIQYAKNISITNCEVASSMLFNMKDTSNPNVGGLVGQICEFATANITNCSVSGIISVVDLNTKNNCVAGLVAVFRNNGTAQQLLPHTEEGLTTGELNGKTFTANDMTGKDTVVNVSGCKVDVTFMKTGDKNTAKDKIYQYYQSTSRASATDLRLKDSNNKDRTPNLQTAALVLNFENNLYFDRDSVADVHENVATLYTTKTTAKGYQVKDLGNGMSSLRYVFSVTGLTNYDKAIGFDVTVEFADGTTREIRVYCPTLYSSINQGENEPLVADTANGEYFFTLMIGNVPTDQLTGTAGSTYLKDAIVTIRSFTAFDEDTRVYGAVKKIGSSDVYGNTVQITQFQNTLPDAFKTAIHADFAAVENNVTYGGSSIISNQLNDGSVIAHGVHKLSTAADTNGVTHYYFEKDENLKSYGYTSYEAFLKISVTVPETGVYDVCFNLRLNDGKTERHTLLQVDDASVKDQYHLWFSVNEEQSKDYNDDTDHGTWAQGLSLELTEGTHVLTFSVPMKDNAFSNWQANSFHFRNIYLVKVAD